MKNHLNYEHRVFNSEEFLKTRAPGDQPFYKQVKGVRACVGVRAWVRVRGCVCMDVCAGVWACTLILALSCAENFFQSQCIQPVLSVLAF